MEGEKGLIKHPSEVDRIIKTTVIGDAIKLMKKYNSGESRKELKNYKCWVKILPLLQNESSNEKNWKLVLKAK